MTPRVALYAVPGTRSRDADAASLLERAEGWLGRSIEGRTPAAAPPPPGWSRADVDAITLDARRYGFHGTLKAPFRLADGYTPADVEQELDRFAAATATVVVPRLSLARIGDFFALVPGGPAAPVNALADALVSGFDRFRAPATAEDVARRRPDLLGERQRELLAEWGYPYVFDEFRFHLTLTDHVPRHRQDEIHDVLAAWFDGVLGRDIPLEAVALLTEAEPGAPFTLRSLHPLHPFSTQNTTPHALDREGTL